jgi:hypothetical protein
MYQIANIYLLLFAGSIWDSLFEAIENPKAILSLISAALPSVSIFFINYIITIWFSGVPYKMIRRFCAMQYLYYRCCTSDRKLTRRMMKNPMGPFGETRVSYGTEISDVLYVLCVVMLYWVIAPLVLLLATGLFWSWYFTWKYQYVFVVTRRVESGGQFWYKIYRYSMTGLVAGTVTFMAYMGIKEGISQGPMLVPLPIIIFICWRHTERRFKHQAQNLAFGTALKHDRFESDGDAHSTAGAGAGAAMGWSVGGKSEGYAPLLHNEVVFDEEGYADTGAATGGEGSRGGGGWAGDNVEQVRGSQHTPSAAAAAAGSAAAESTHPHPHHVSSTFRANFMVQPNLLCPSKIYPYPYRLHDVPLLDPNGALSEIYLEEIPEGVDPAALLYSSETGSYTSASGSSSSNNSSNSNSNGYSTAAAVPYDPAPSFPSQRGGSSSATSSSTKAAAAGHGLKARNIGAGTGQGESQDNSLSDGDKLISL